MKIHSKLAIVGVSMALGAAPAIAVAAGNPNHPSGPPAGVTTGTPANQGTAHKPTNPGSQGTAHMPTSPGNQGTTPDSGQPTAGASLPAKAKAYGRYCQGESKTHVAGQKGTPFSQCVTAMAKAAHADATTGQSDAKTAKSACSSLSKKHVAGQKGTPFSVCVSGAEKLLKSQKQSGTSSTGTGS